MSNSKREDVIVGSSNVGDQPDSSQPGIRIDSGTPSGTDMHSGLALMQRILEEARKPGDTEIHFFVLTDGEPVVDRETLASLLDQHPIIEHELAPWPGVFQHTSESDRFRQFGELSRYARHLPPFEDPFFMPSGSMHGDFNYGDHVPNLDGHESFGDVFGPLFEAWLKEQGPLPLTSEVNAACVDAACPLLEAYWRTKGTLKTAADQEGGEQK